MPQLMPLMWISSSIMFFLLICVFVNLYYLYILNCELSLNEKLNFQHMLKW